MTDNAIFPHELLIEIATRDPRAYGALMSTCHRLHSDLRSLDVWEIFAWLIDDPYFNREQVREYKSISYEKRRCVYHGKMKAYTPDSEKYARFIIYSYGNHARTIWYRVSDNTIRCCLDEKRKEITFTRRNGQVKRLIKLNEDNKQHGDTILYRKNGYLKRVLVFDNGYLISRSEYSRAGYHESTTRYKTISRDLGMKFLTLEEKSTDYSDRR